MKKNKHAGSTFESFLEEADILEDVNSAAIKTIIVQHLKEYMSKNQITQTQMAKMLRTSRSALVRLLDPDNYSVTLLTINRAASIVGKKINIKLDDVVKHKK